MVRLTFLIKGFAVNSNTILKSYSESCKRTIRDTLLVEMELGNFAETPGCNTTFTKVNFALACARAWCKSSFKFLI
jgi:hypothetical protein